MFLDAYQRIDTFEGRSSLLRALPSVHTLDRNSSNTKQDLVGIVDQLSHLGQTSSQQWPLILLLGTVILIGALNFLPALTLGPIVEHFLMQGGKLF